MFEFERNLILLNDCIFLSLLQNVQTSRAEIAPVLRQSQVISQFQCHHRAQWQLFILITEQTGPLQGHEGCDAVCPPVNLPLTYNHLIMFCRNNELFTKNIDKVISAPLRLFLLLSFFLCYYHNHLSSISVFPFCSFFFFYPFVTLFSFYLLRLFIFFCSSQHFHFSFLFLSAFSFPSLLFH